MLRSFMHQSRPTTAGPEQCPARADIESSRSEMIHPFRELKSEMKMPRDRDREVKFLEKSREIFENQEILRFCKL